MQELVRQQVNDGISLLSYKAGLSLGTDSLLLASFLRGNPKWRAAELGTGTGILSLLVAFRNKACDILAAEVQEKYADLAMRNVSENGLQDRITVLCQDIRTWAQGNLVGSFDCVFTNPPYFPLGSGYRSESDDNFIARHEVFGTLSDFLHTASRLLRFGGRFFIVYPAERMCELFAYAREARLEPKRVTVVHPSPTEAANLCLLECVMGGKCGLRVTKPLFLYTDKTHKEETPEMRAIHLGSDLLSEEL